MNQKFRRECLRLAMEAQSQAQINATFAELTSQPELADLTSIAKLLDTTEDQA